MKIMLAAFVLAATVNFAMAPSAFAHGWEGRWGGWDHDYRPHHRHHHHHHREHRGFPLQWEPPRPRFYPAPVVIYRPVPFYGRHAPYPRPHRWYRDEGHW